MVLLACLACLIAGATLGFAVAAICNAAQSRPGPAHKDTIDAVRDRHGTYRPRVYRYRR